MSARPNTTIVTRYLHGQEDELSDLWPYDAPMQGKYHYSLYEVAVELEVDLDTGESRIKTVDGAPLAEEQEWR